jgi:hypothetical protein
MNVLLASSASIDVLIWVGVLLGGVLSGSLIILSMRKSLFAPHDQAGDSGTLMEQMRRMHQRGEISPEEYEKVRRRLVEKASGKRADDR